MPKGERLARQAHAWLSSSQLVGRTMPNRSSPTPSVRHTASAFLGTGVLRGTEFVPTETLNARSERGATALSRAGVGVGDAVAILMRNDHPFFEVSFAAGILGAHAVPMNWHATASEFGYIVRDSNAKVLVAHSDLAVGVMT